MEAEVYQLLNVLEGPEKELKIPIYQRYYDWKIENCERLMNDINNVISSPNQKTHFFGSVVYKLYGNFDTTWIIIDGQQRITTISLLLIALVNRYRDLGPDNSKADTIEAEFLKVRNGISKSKKSNEIKLRLKLVKKDNHNYQNILNNNTQSEDQPSNIQTNYNYFYNQIKNYSIETLDNIYHALEKFQIVRIKIEENDDDEQLIFECLNSTGLDLSEADKIRNLMLMPLPYDEQESYHDTYWKEFEKNTGKDLEKFFKDYITLRQHKTPKEKNIYTIFKNDIFSKHQESIKNLANDILKISEYYSFLTGIKKHQDENISKYFAVINKLDLSVFRPLLLELLEDFDKKLFDKKLFDKKLFDKSSFIEMLSLIESMIIRRYFCDFQTNAFAKLIPTIGKEVKKHTGKISYLEAFKYVVKHKIRYPSDNEFSEKFIQKNVYGNDKKLQFILEKLENYNNKELIDISSLIEKKIYSIEHVMPQTLTKEWKEKIGDKYDEIHEKYLHTIGNLTLTAYNPELSNKLFTEKKEYLLDSKLRINNYFTECDVWGEKQITERSKKLLQIAKNIWKPCLSSYKPVNESLTFNLTEDKDVKGYKPTTITIDEYDHTIDSWREAQITILKHLYNIDHAKLIQVIEINQSKLKHYYSTNNNNNFGEKGNIFEKIYFEKHKTANNTVDAITLIWNLFGKDIEAIAITLKDKNDD